MGIKAGSLTVNNIVVFDPNGNGFPKRVIEARENDIVCTSLYESSTQRLALYYDSPYLFPLDISEHWLKLLGFEQGQREQYSIEIPETVRPTILLLKRHKHTANGWVTKLVYSTGGWILPHQKTVHQLQNLYASLAPGHFLTLKK